MDVSVCPAVPCISSLQGEICDDLFGFLNPVLQASRLSGWQLFLGLATAPPTWVACALTSVGSACG